MTGKTFSRRHLLKTSAAAGFTVFAAPLRAQAPAPAAITPALVEAAKKEGKVAFYTAMDLPVAEKLRRSARSEMAGQDRQGASGL